MAKTDHDPGSRTVIRRTNIGIFCRKIINFQLLPLPQIPLITSYQTNGLEVQPLLSKQKADILGLHVDLGNNAPGNIVQKMFVSKPEKAINRNSIQTILTTFCPVSIM